jgi:hypothetical protein
VPVWTDSANRRIKEARLLLNVIHTDGEEARFSNAAMGAISLPFPDERTLRWVLDSDTPSCTKSQQPTDTCYLDN